MARRKQAPKDLTGIRQRGSTYQVRISGGYDPVTGRQLFLSGSAETEDAVIVLRDGLRRQVQEATAAGRMSRLGTSSMSGSPVTVSGQLLCSGSSALAREACSDLKRAMITARPSVVTPPVPPMDPVVLGTRSVVERSQ